MITTKIYQNIIKGFFILQIILRKTYPVDTIQSDLQVEYQFIEKLVPINKYIMSCTRCTLKFKLILSIIYD